MIGPITLQAATSAASNVTSGWLELGDYTGCSITCAFTGSDVAGTLKLECADDDSKTNPTDVASSSQAITSSADHRYNISGAQYKYVRVDWTASSGTGNITVTGIIKEPNLPK